MPHARVFVSLAVLLIALTFGAQPAAAGYPQYPYGAWFGYTNISNGSWDRTDPVNVMCWSDNGNTRNACKWDHVTGAQGGYGLVTKGWGSNVANSIQTCCLNGGVWRDYNQTQAKGGWIGCTTFACRNHHRIYDLPDGQWYHSFLAVSFEHCCSGLAHVVDEFYQAEVNAASDVANSPGPGYTVSWWESQQNPPVCIGNGNIPTFNPGTTNCNGFRNVGYDVPRYWNGVVQYVRMG